MCKEVIYMYVHLKYILHLCMYMNLRVFVLFIDIYVISTVSLLLCKLDKIGQYHMFSVSLSHLCTCITLHIEHSYDYTCKYVYVIPDKLF